MPSIRVVLNKKTNETTVGVTCVKGADCLSLTQHLEQAINGAQGANRELTEEFYEDPQKKIVEQDG